MKSVSRHLERHKTHRIGWLRAAVLGANDGILSTSSLVIGIAASNVTHGAILVSGVAGLVAGSMSMAAGEYVSVSSQSDTEKADTAHFSPERDSPSRRRPVVSSLWRSIAKGCAEAASAINGSKLRTLAHLVFRELAASMPNPSDVALCWPEMSRAAESG